MTQPDDTRGGPMITIGLRDVYGQLQVVATNQTALGAKIDTIVASHGQQLLSIQEDVKDHEHRLRLIEARPVVTPRAVWTAAALVVSSLGLILVLIQTLVK